MAYRKTKRTRDGKRMKRKQKNGETAKAVEKKNKKPARTAEEKAMKKADRKTRLQKFFRKFGLVLFGATVYAAGLGMFLDPHNLSAGGVAGIAMLLNHFFPVIGTGIFILILNIPILIYGTWRFGAKFMGFTAFVLAYSSPLIDLFAGLHLGVDDLLLNALLGGALLGSGMGFLFRAGASSGGVDILTKSLHKRFPHMKMGIIHFGLDLVVLTVTLIVFRQIDIVLYAVVGLVASSYMMNTTLYGTDGARLVYIVSDKPEELSEELMRHQHLGLTYLQGFGAYTGKEKRVIMCVLRPKQLPKAREFVAQCDPHAFMIISGASAVFGVGFKPYDDEVV